jgi:hypothetical protein
MHSTETQHRFIELRAKGRSLASIAEEISVSKRTLIDWNRQFETEIADFKVVELEALHEKVLTSHEAELTRLAAHLDRIETVLAKRNLDYVSTESLFCLAATVRAQLRKQTALPPLSAVTPPSTCNLESAA